MRTLINPRGEAVRLILSDGTERIVPAWGIAIVPESGRDGRPLTVVRSEHHAMAGAEPERKAA